MTRFLATMFGLLIATIFLSGFTTRKPAACATFGACQLPIANYQSSSLVVSPDGPYMTIQAALDEAQDGDTIEVRGGRYAGPLVVEKSVTLQGVDWPVIDGGGRGTVVTLAAPGVIFRGFEVRGSGVEPDRDHAGITLTAPQITVEGNRLRDVLFGIFVAQADDAQVRGNDISSKDDYETGRRGDAIRLWYSVRAIIENNHVHDARDVVIWYSTGVIMRGNLIEGGRYGIHLMYCDQAQVENNRLLNNSVGVYTMYSNDVTLRDNLIQGQRGPSGYALGFKDADNVLVAHNTLVDNGAGAFLDGLPFSPQGYGRFENNILAFNDVGFILQPAVRGATFTSNTFWENVEQVAVQGGGQLGENRWQGNYWSDYTGFDADGDGQGDIPYQAERFFESLTDREPRLRALLYSPAAQAIEMAAQTFPIIRPQPKLTDPSPSVQPAPLPNMVSPEPAASASVPAGFMIVLTVLLGLLGLPLLRKWTRIGRISGFGKRQLVSSNDSNMNQPLASYQLPITNDHAPIRVTNLGKRFGKAQVLRQVTFDVPRGRAIPLWGPNGAGKTTLLKAILGLLDFDGDIEIEGHDVKRQGKLARRQMGYVPQEVIFYDWTVAATMSFYARLKQVRSSRLSGREVTEVAPANLSGRIPTLLQQLGLLEHQHKAVSTLSGGLRQRLALAVALLADPPILLLDEPTANLDAQARREYLSLLATLRRQGKTILFASHRLEELEILADQVVILEAGQLVEVITPEALRQRLDPAVEMTLWLPEPQRSGAVRLLQEQGLPAHLNGRGTVVVTVHNGRKMQMLDSLTGQGISVLDFEL
ncbi:MAG: nitrous oxide reductase family maturation protein NosD [Chloroflexota bacterium]